MLPLTTQCHYHLFAIITSTRYFSLSGKVVWWTAYIILVPIFRNHCDVTSTGLWIQKRSSKQQILRQLTRVPWNAHLKFTVSGRSNQANIYNAYTCMCAMLCLWNLTQITSHTINNRVSLYYLCPYNVLHHCTYHISVCPWKACSHLL